MINWSFKLELESISIDIENLKDWSIHDSSNKFSVLHVHIKSQNKYKQMQSKLKSIPFLVYRRILSWQPLV